MPPGADIAATNNSSSLPPAAPGGAQPGLALLISTLTLCAAFGGWWSRGTFGSPSPSADLAEVAAVPPDPPDAPARARADGPPDIALVTIGSLRADRAGVGGHGRDAMPFLRELARDKGQWFRAAVGTSSWGLPSAASILTGQLPSGHGLVLPPRATGPKALELQTLPEDMTTLAERLSRAGYHTRAVVADPTLARATGLGRGFDDYINLGYARAQRVQALVERFGEEHRKKADKPLFVWVHYSDPTAPYAANPWAYFWGAIDGTDAPSATDEDLSLLSRANLQQLGPLVGPGPRQVALETLYDSEVRLVDDHLQLLPGDLGLDDGDLLVIAGLNGEEFLDHGGLGAGRTLHEELVRVPLVLSWPARWPVPQRIAEPVSLAEVMPTIAEAAGVPFRANGKVPARSLVPLIEGVERPAGQRISTELGTKCRAIYDANYKVIGTGHPPLQVYDLDADPSEQEPVDAEDRAIRPLKAAFVATAVTPVTAGTTTIELNEATLGQIAAMVPSAGPCW